MPFIKFFSGHMCGVCVLPVCSMCITCDWSWGQKRALGPMELGLGMIMSQHIGARTKSRSSARPTTALNHRTISQKLPWAKDKFKTLYKYSALKYCAKIIFFNFKISRNGNSLPQMLKFGFSPLVWFAFFLFRQSLTVTHWLAWNSEIQWPMPLCPARDFSPNCRGWAVPSRAVDPVSGPDCGRGVGWQSSQGPDACL